jgi:hypothetical protein
VSETDCLSFLAALVYFEFGSCDWAATTLYAARGRRIPFNSNSPTGSTFTAFSTFINTGERAEIGLFGDGGVRAPCRRGGDYLAKLNEPFGISAMLKVLMTHMSAVRGGWRN